MLRESFGSLRSNIYFNMFIKNSRRLNNNLLFNSFCLRSYLTVGKSFGVTVAAKYQRSNAQLVNEPLLTVIKKPSPENPQRFTIKRAYRR